MSPCCSFYYPILSCLQQVPILLRQASPDLSLLISGRHAQNCLYCSQVGVPRPAPILLIQASLDLYPLVSGWCAQN
ncbi:hypothetical protein XELAEV_18032316mg [Xenopus laevis]|uniref:Uncharacterized protein n=1 Tax=Xenopus laevis TaxID=8355 RepID=A0A974HGI6_XENLA|nr:hypothetical protein XELAEV_18032316mg [Xenopus laevis]